jgi:hypothetical protein
MTAQLFLAFLLGAAALLASERQARRNARQAQEEKIERVLDSLEKRCKKMELAQRTIQTGIVNIQRAIERNPGKKPIDRDQAAARLLADIAKDSIKDVNDAIELLTKEGSAVAFPEVFEQLRLDMIMVHDRLKNGDAGPKTLQLQDDVVETLWEMTRALVKTR